MTPAPSITPEMRKSALEKAMESRRKVAGFKQDLRDGKATFKDAFAARDDEAIGRMKVAHLLQTLPGVGSARAEEIMREIRIAPSRRLKGLGARQVEELLKVEERYRS